MIWWIWFGKLGTYIKGKRVVDLVHSRNSNYLRIRLILLTKSIIRSVLNKEGRENKSLKIYSLFNYLERSSSSI